MANISYKIVQPARLENYPFEPGTERMIPYMFENYGELDEQGYIEKELLCSGTDEFGEPYTTVALVRLPADPKKFSGMLVVEPFHICPMLPLYVYAAKAILRGNHGWAAVCGKKCTLDHDIAGANPQRYPMLHIAAGETGEAVNKIDFTNVPNDYDEGIAWYESFLKYNRADTSILAQVGAALKNSAGLPEGYNVRHIILGGHSFTGFTTTRYIHCAHDQFRMPDGAAIYEGFFPSGWPSEALRNVDVPVVHTITAADICTANEMPMRYQIDNRLYRREDSDAPGDRYRLYEFPGFGHASMQFPPTNEVDFVLSITEPPLLVPEGAVSNTLPFVEYHAAALDRLLRWVADGVVPPREARMDYDETDNQEIFLKDANGNITGGVRCPQMDVPTAMYMSNTYNEDGSVRFGGNGFELPFTPDKLCELYGTVENYQKLFDERVRQAEQAGWLFPEDAQVLMEQAREISF